MKEMVSLFLVSFSAIFVVVDVVGIVPLFIAMTVGDSKGEVRSTALRACVTASAILIFFALCGGLFFKVLGVSLAAFRVAGGLLLLITALDMLRNRPSATRTSPREEREGVEKEDVAIVPLAIPLFAGPGAIATVMVLMTKGKSTWTAVPVVLAILVTFAVNYFVLRAAPWVQRVLGTSGAAIVERVMGLVLAGIAVQIMAEGGRALLLGPAGS